MNNGFTKSAVVAMAVLGLSIVGCKSDTTTTDAGTTAHDSGTTIVDLGSAADLGTADAGVCDPQFYQQTNFGSSVTMGGNPVSGLVPRCQASTLTAIRACQHLDGGAQAITTCESDAVSADTYPAFMGMDSAGTFTLGCSSCMNINFDFCIASIDSASKQVDGDLNCCINSMCADQTTSAGFNMCLQNLCGTQLTALQAVFMTSAGAQCLSDLNSAYAECFSTTDVGADAGVTTGSDAGIDSGT